MVTRKLKDIKDFESMTISVHRVNEDKELKKEAHTNLHALVGKILDAWANDREAEMKSLEDEAIEEILRIHTDLDRARAITWLYTTLALFQTKLWVQKKT